MVKTIRMKELKDDYDFFNYITSLGLIKKDPNLLVLSSAYHYYYNLNEFENIKTIVHLKKLNYVNNLNDFLKSIYNLQKDTIFCGCFIVDSKIKDILRSFLDFKINRSLSRKDVHTLFNIQNFKILNMKEINGITYFQSIKK
jgi:hypothetical protein